MLYLDTSALVKLYIQEDESEAVRRLSEANEGLLCTSIAAYAETLAVLARCLREGRLADSAYRSTKRAFLADWKSFHAAGLNERILAPAARVIERHGLRGFDAVHLCAALWMGRPLFACFDTRLRAAAEAEGLTLVPPRLRRIIQPNG